MLKSIDIYKGFYIGRYETGDAMSHENYYYETYFKSPKIVRYNRNIDHVSWYDTYIDLEKLSGKTEKYVETGMIFDCLWGYTLKWLNDTDTKTYEEISKNSGIWGNYENLLKYKESADGEEKTREAGMHIKMPTGGITEITHNGGIYNNYPTLTNNIFDLSGNVVEHTRGVYNDYSRCSRGGVSGNPYASTLWYRRTLWCSIYLWG